MKAWTQTISLTLPLRDAQLALAGEASVVAERHQREREEAAYQRGRTEMERTLRDQMEAQRRELQALQEGILASLSKALPKVVRESESVLIQLAVEVAQKLVSGLPISLEMVETGVREALAQVEESTDTNVCIHPDDMALLQQNNSPLLQADTGGKRVKFQPSSEISRGGCIVQTNYGTIDARRETKVELLKKSLHS